MGGVASGVGFVTWDVCANKLHGDEVFACLFGFSVSEAKEGICIEAVMARIIPGDRERIAREVHTALLTGQPYATSYSIGTSTRNRQVVYHGRCLRDADGLPTFFSGTISQSEGPVEEGNSAEALCLTALSVAKRQQNEVASRFLANALDALHSPRQ